MNVGEIIRLEENFGLGTFGMFRINKELFSSTLEPRDEENRRDISSIPAQQYLCVPTVSPKFGYTYEIMDVPGRTNVLFHWGNYVKDTTGCVILGVFGKINNERALVSSKRTFNEFMHIMNNEDFHLTIHEFY